MPATITLRRKQQCHAYRNASMPQAVFTCNSPRPSHSTCNIPSLSHSTFNSPSLKLFTAQTFTASGCLAAFRCLVALLHLADIVDWLPFQPWNPHNTRNCPSDRLLAVRRPCTCAFMSSSNELSGPGVQQLNRRLEGLSRPGGAARLWLYGHGAHLELP